MPRPRCSPAHAPASARHPRFESFWALVDEALSPDGQVFFFDDNDRPDAELVAGPTSPIVQLADGSSFNVLKIPHEPGALEQRLGHLGWRIAVTPTSGAFYWGTRTRSAFAMRGRGRMSR